MASWSTIMPLGSRIDAPIRCKTTAHVFHPRQIFNGLHVRLPPYVATLARLTPAHHRDHRAAEVGEVIGLAARDMMPVHDDAGVFPDRPGVDEIVLDPR